MKSSTPTEKKLAIEALGRSGEPTALEVLAPLVRR